MVEFVPAAQSAAVVSKTISRLVHDSFLCYYYEKKIGELDGSNIEIAWSILSNVDMHDMVCEVHYPSADLLRTASSPRLPGGVPELRTRVIVVVIWVKTEANLLPFVRSRGSGPCHAMLIQDTHPIVHRAFIGTKQV